MSNFEIIRRIACKLGVSAPESDGDIYSPDFLNSIKRSINSVYNELVQAHARISVLENSGAYRKYQTSPAESLAGIALRELGDETLWLEIARLNSLKFPEMSANDYYPVGTYIILPQQ
jgi:hypothetical protein